jgi:heme oxygenase
MATRKPAAKKTVSRKPTQRLYDDSEVAAMEAKGAARRRSQAIADAYAAGTRIPPPEESHELPDNATPLDVLIMAMRRAFLVGGSTHAAQFAEKAAPYMHGKISTIELKNAVRNPDGSGTGQSGPQPFVIEFVQAEDGRPKES